MILHDRIILTYPTASGKFDEFGSPTGTSYALSQPVPAEISPVQSDETLNATSDAIVTTFRLTLRAGVIIDTTTIVKWRGTDYAVQGNIEPHMVNGRVHHQECLIRSYNG